ncbi:hypothetical protein SOM26_06110 [Sphingomonas sp. CFBP8993]|nr:hypothetical protein [Sphingomonas sp. CFBP8993]
MLNKLTAAPLPDAANDMTVLMERVQSCIALADRLELQHVAIYLDQARALLAEKGAEDQAAMGMAPLSFSVTPIDPQP